MVKRRTYYTLVERDGPAHPWRIEFGDFTRGLVEAELDDRRDHGVRLHNLKIVASGPSDADQIRAVAALNNQPRRLITITWRDEAYGALSGVVAGFRLYDTVGPSDAAVRRIGGKARRAGFALHVGRCSWVSYEEGAPEQFIEGLKALGFAVLNAGCKAESLAHLNSPQATDQVEAA